MVVCWLPLRLRAKIRQFKNKNFSKKVGPEMGKGSRNRQERIDDKAVNPQKYVQKKKTASKNYTSLITVIVTLVVAFTLIFSMVSSSGILLRTRNTISSDNFKVTGTMMSYYAHTVYSGYVNQYQEMYGSLLSQNSGYSVYTLMGIDPDKSLKDQMFNETTGETWFDYFMTQAREQTEQLLLYCEGAKAAGIELDEEDMAEIDSSISLLAAYASYYGYSTKAYIRSLYGKGVNERDVRNAMKLSTLATKFTTKLAEDFESAATAEDVEKFYNDHVNDYLYADYLSYKLDASLSSLGEDATAEDIAAAKKAVDDAAKTMMDAKTTEEFNAAVKAYLSTTMAGDYKYEDYLTTAEGETDEEKEANAKKTAQEKLDAAIQTKLDAMLVEDYAYNTSTPVGKWIFGEEAGKAAAANTTFKDVVDTEAKTDEDPDDDKDTSTKAAYTVTVYFLKTAAARNEDATYKFAYLALPGTSYKEEDAKAAFDEFVKAGATKDALLAMNTKYTSHAGCTEVENVVDGYFGMEDVDAWAFDSARKVGDYELLTGKSGDSTYYFIVLAQGEGNKVWYVDALADLIVSENDKWLEEAAKTYPVKVNEKALNGVNM